MKLVVVMLAFAVDAFVDWKCCHFIIFTLIIVKQLSLGNTT